MRRASCYMSPSRIRIEILWREFVANDPELSALEAKKQEIAHRRIVETHTRRAQERHINMLCTKIANAVAVVVIEAFVVIGFMALLFVA